MRIAIDINGVLRDTIGKFKQLYEKHLIDSQQSEYLNPTYTIDLSGNTEIQNVSEPFEYKILSDVSSLDLKNHFAFQNEEEYYSFMYEEYCMELFGHAPSIEMSTFYDLNSSKASSEDIYLLENTYPVPNLDHKGIFQHQPFFRAVQ